MNTIRNILIYCLAIVSALSCIKDGKVGDMSSYAITFAPETPQTKAFIDGSFPTGSKMVVFDYMTKLDGTDGWYYIDQASIEGSGSGNVWDYSENSEYLWIYDTSHNFFGWLTSDGTTTSNVSWNAENGVLSVPKKKFEATSTQYDFLYSDVIKRSYTRERPDNRSVDLTMNHLYSAFKFKVQNKRTSEDIRINSITLNGIYTTKSATIDFDGNGVSPFPDTPVVQYADKATESIAKTLNTTLVKSTGVIENVFSTGEDYFMVWPQTADEFDDASIEIKFSLGGGEEQTKTFALKDLGQSEWLPGHRYSYNITFSEKEIVLTCTVQDWYVKTENIEFSDQVTVYKALEWDENSVESIDETKGEVVLYTDDDMVAEAYFQINSPQGATWTASLIPVEGHQDAFTLVEGAEPRLVGTLSKIKIKVNNQAPIAPKHVCILRVTVQTADGRTIVVKNLVSEDKPYEEFRIIQNLING